MGFLDFLFSSKKKDATPTASTDTVQRDASIATPTGFKPFVFKSTCHQRFENSHEVMGLQKCVRTVSVEKNTNGCRGYRLAAGDGYIVKIFNDDLNKPNMSDKPMRIVSKSDEKVVLRGFPIEAQTPFGWQQVDYRDYGLTIYYQEGKVDKCVLHMYDRHIDIEYRANVATTVRNGLESVTHVKPISQGAAFQLSFNKVRVLKQNYDRTSSEVALTTPIKANVSRSTQGGNIQITFSDLSELRRKGLLQNNLTLSPQFSYNAEANGDEFASAEINNSFAAMSSSKEYISLFQITKQNGKIVSFLINNLPGDQDFYYLIVLQD